MPDQRVPLPDLDASGHEKKFGQDLNHVFVIGPQPSLIGLLVSDRGADLHGSGSYSREQSDQLTLPEDPGSVSFHPGR